jgi:hypothetical protein
LPKGPVPLQGVAQGLIEIVRSKVRLFLPFLCKCCVVATRTRQGASRKVEPLDWSGVGRPSPTRKRTKWWYVCPVWARTPSKSFRRRIHAGLRDNPVRHGYSHIPYGLDRLLRPSHRRVGDGMRTNYRARD